MDAEIKCVYCSEKPACPCVHLCKFHKGIYHPAQCLCDKRIEEEKKCESERCLKRSKTLCKIEQAKKILEDNGVILDMQHKGDDNLAVINNELVDQLMFFKEEAVRKSKQLEELNNLHKNIVDTYQARFNELVESVQMREYETEKRRSLDLEQIEILRMKINQFEHERKKNNSPREPHFSRRESVSTKKKVKGSKKTRTLKPNKS